LSELTADFGSILQAEEFQVFVHLTVTYSSGGSGGGSPGGLTCAGETKTFDDKAGEQEVFRNR
jgi:hypothetical protein